MGPCQQACAGEDGGVNNWVVQNANCVPSGGLGNNPYCSCTCQCVTSSQQCNPDAQCPDIRLDAVWCDDGYWGSGCYPTSCCGYDCQQSFSSNPNDCSGGQTMYNCN